MLSGKRAGHRLRVRRRAPPERDGELAERIALDPPRRGDPQRRRLRRGCGARDRRDGASCGRARSGSRRRRPTCCSSAASTCPGQGMPLFELRPPVLAGTDWVGEEGVRPRCQLRRPPGRAALLASDRARDQARLARAGALPRPAGGRRRARVRDAQVPDDGGGSGGAPGRARGTERGGGRALQDSRGSSLDARRQVPSKALARRAAAGAECPRRRDEPRRPAAAAGAGLPTASRRWHRKRYNVLPGITGLWQISGRSSLTFDDLVRLDFYYIENWSIWLDISILVKTLPAVIAGRGAY